MTATVDVGNRRDSGLTALVLGFFAAGWFSWTPEATGALAVGMKTGSVAAVVVAVLGAMRAFRGPRLEGALNDSTTGRRYWLLVIVEFAVGGVGAEVLALAGAARYVPVWICLVVGLHFFPLARVLHAPAARGLGVVVTAVGGAALVLGVLADVAPSNVTGPGAGVALLTYATLMLVGPTR